MVVFRVLKKPPNLIPIQYSGWYPINRMSPSKLDTNQF